MNKQEAIERIKNIDTLNINDMIAGQQVDMVIKNQVLDIISQIDEPQKPVVPKFVAEWLEYCKRSGWHLQKALSRLDDDEKVGDWTYDENDDLIAEKVETFARAWLAYPNITFEKEKLYTVEIADAILTKITRGRNVQHKMLPYRDVSGFFDKAIYNTKLTEQEIIGADKRLWQFAKEVE